MGENEEAEGSILGPSKKLKNRAKGVDR